MHAERLFLQDLALVLCVAALTTVVFRRLRQPVVLGYLLAGLLVGPNTPVRLFPSPERIQTLSELGVILVMFSIGLEFSLRRLAHVFPRAGLTGLVQIMGMLWLGHAAARTLGWSPRECVFTGTIVAISSTMIVAKVFDEQRVKGRLAELVYGVLIIQDLAAILFMAFLTTLAPGPQGGAGPGGETEVLVGTAWRLLGFLFGLTVAGYLLVPRALRYVARLASPETLLVASVGLCFAFATLAERAGYSVALGAFVAGALVAESGKQRQVQPLIAPLRDLFAAVFFVAVGMLVNPATLLDSWPAVLLLFAVVVLGQFACVTLGAFLGGIELRIALQAGLALTQIGEFSFILAATGVALGAIDPALYSVVISVAVLTAFTTPWLVRLSGPLSLAVERRMPRRLRLLATLYAHWLEGLRSGLGEGGKRYRLPRLAGWLVLDVLLFAGVVIATSVTQERLQVLLEDAGLSARVAHLLILAGAALVAAPFGAGIVRLSAAVGAELAAGALADEPPPGPGEGAAQDASAPPRRAFVVTLQLAVFAVVSGPLLALTQPFVPVLYEAGAVLIALALMAIVFWRSASKLEEHVRTGAQMVAEALRSHNRFGGASGEELEPLLPGLGEITPLRLEGSSPAIGRTLAELDLRATTGATVLSITRDDGGVVAPSGREPLLAGDVLALAGSREAVQAARLLLAAPALPSGPREQRASAR